MRKTCKSLLMVFFLLFCTAATAQDPWSDFFDYVRNGAVRTRAWALMVQKPILDGLGTDIDRGLWQLLARNQTITNIDSDYLPLLASRDMSIHGVEINDVADVWRYMGWNDNVHWVLCNLYDEKDYYTGAGFPSASEVRGLMQKSGYTPTLERARSFLKLYPDSGPANDEQVYIALQLMRAKFVKALQTGKARTRPAVQSVLPGWTQIANRGGILIDREAADEVYSDLIVALGQYMAMQDWWLTSNIFYYGVLNFYDPTKSPQMNGILNQMADAVFKEWQKYPSNFSLESMWTRIIFALKDVYEVPWIEPSPGDIFPSTSLVREFDFIFSMRGQFKEAISFYDAVIEQLPPPETVWNRQGYIAMMENYWSAKSFLYACLGDKDKCLESLGHYRTWAGEKWNTEDGDVRLGIKQVAPNLFAQEELERDIPNFGSYEDFLPPLPRQLRVIIFDNTRWLPQLHQIARFWTGEELYIGPGTEGDRALLADAIEASAGWAFLRGDNPINHGFGLDNLKTALESELSQQASKYQLLTQYIARHPQTIEGREKRYKLAQSLYGKEALLEESINDALLANTTIDFDPNVEYSEGIRNNVAHHITRLRQVIYRWPYTLYSDELSPNNPHKLWEVLLSWNKIANTKNLVTDMIDEINFFDDPIVWMPRLPKAVHAEVIREYKAANRVNDIKDWLETTLEGIERLKARKFEYDKELLDMTNEFMLTLAIVPQ